MPRTDPKKGRPERQRGKKKGHKADVTSKFSAQRLLSRYGKKQKKGMAGPSTEFCTRGKAIFAIIMHIQDLTTFSNICFVLQHSFCSQEVANHSEGLSATVHPQGHLPTCPQ